MNECTNNRNNSFTYTVLYIDNIEMFISLWNQRGCDGIVIKDLCCFQIGMKTRHVKMTGTSSQADIINTIHLLNDDPAVNGIILEASTVPE